MKDREFYWWKCQKCGGMIQRCTAGEPRICPFCRDRGCKDFRGHGRKPESRPMRYPPVKQADVSFSGYQAHLILFAFDNHYDVDANGIVTKSRYGASLLTLQGIRSKLFEAHEHEPREEADEPK